MNWVSCFVVRTSTYVGDWDRKILPIGDTGTVHKADKRQTTVFTRGRFSSLFSSLPYFSIIWSTASWLAISLEFLKPLQNHQNGWVFNVPVDPVELNLPDNFEGIKRPMDLGTVQRRLDSGNFHSFENFVSDVNLTFDNAMAYNQEGSVVYNIAKEMKDQFTADYQKLLVQLKKEDDERRKNEKGFTLCGCEKLLFEPLVYFCNGLNCASNRIRRNSHYYIGGNNQYYWCNQCFNELKETEPIELMDMTIKKADLKKKKNDEVHEESWVECEVCNHWIHQICALFNSSQNTKEHTKEYHCPHCLLKKSNEGSKAKTRSNTETPHGRSSSQDQTVTMAGISCKKES